METLGLMLGQASEGGPQGAELLIWIVVGLVALWVTLKVLRVLTNVFARLIWVAALIAAVVWVILALK